MKTRISASNRHVATLVDLLRWRTDSQPNQRIYSFLTDGETEKDALTYAELDRQAKVIAASLQERIPAGERALLIYPSGLEFITAFFGCLYSGIIAVPVYPPSTVRSDRALTKFRAIASNVEAQTVLTSTSLSSKVSSLIKQTPELHAAHVYVTDTLTSSIENQWHMPEISADTLAFLQYTSGSTGIPKGVMVTHGNLLHNSAIVERYCQHPADAHGVTWLPLYHDLGLIGGVLQPLYAGYESTVMAPTTFLQRPYRWLQAISRTKATISGGPNFAYDLCVRKITKEQKETLDLSHWEIVANGAEPVRAETMERFAEAFAISGFRRPYFYPCYGLAEATLVVSAGTKGVYPTVSTFQGEGLEKNQALEVAATEPTGRTLVSIGKSQPDQRVLIVDPQTFTQCPNGQVGEIWVSGPSVAKGYWKRPQETAETFEAFLAPDHEGPFLRTGDLGFMHSDEIFITGRLKDLIIIRGSNHYPQDIERTMESTQKAIRLNGSAAFSIETEGEERLTVVCEVERTSLSSNLTEVVAALRQVIAQQHEIQVYAITLIKPGSLPKTSSGKVQRRGTRESYLAGTLDVIYTWKLDDEEPAQVASASRNHRSTARRKERSKESSVVTMPETSLAQSVQHEMQVATMRTDAPDETTEDHQGPDTLAIQNWLVEHVSQALRVQVQNVDVRAPLAFYGMDSAQAIMLSSDLEDYLGRSLPPTLVYDYPTIEEMAQYLAGESKQSITPADADIPQPALAGGQNHDHEAGRNDIAIIGIGCRFPQADNPEAFWQLLRNGVDGISEVPAERWNLQQYYDEQPATPGKMNTRWGGFLSHVDLFDPTFFGISPREAAAMDPQQRLLLEVAWETFEQAGLVPERLAGSQTGVFVGISSDDYSRLQYTDPQQIDAYAGTGNAHSIAANRLSYVFDLRGPSIALDTACSSSLLAVHQACQSLRNGECDVALAGGVNLVLSPELTITFSQARMMSPNGHCKTFDDSADGYVRGEGCGLVLLKPLAAARRDGDTILAVVRGSAVNQDGRSNGLTAPNGPSQEEVIRQALHNAAVEPQEVRYVETHGSSTPLGDPIEVAALKAVLMPHRTAEQTCALGAVKTNIGHLESAAGIAGLIKTVLSMQKGEIFPNLNFSKLNQHISLEDTTFVIPTQRQPWPAGPRIAGVSAFGFGGTNVHLVLEAAPQTVAVENEQERPLHLLTLSAYNEHTLQRQAQNYLTYLNAHPDVEIADLCFSANTGHTHFNERLAITTSGPHHLREQLTRIIHSDYTDVQHAHRNPREAQKIAFLFTGQGSQYIDMANQLYETQPTFKEALDRCDQILRAYLDQPLLSVIYPAHTASEQERALLHETAYTQPALFAIEYALATLWRSWGVEPDIVMGHSVGEYVAACIAGMLTLEDGLKLVAARGRLMQELSVHGSMTVVFEAPEKLASVIAPFEQYISIAAINGPSNTVLSGDPDALQTITRQLEGRGISVHPMTVSHAFHSPLLEPMLDDFEHIAQEIVAAPLQIPLVSNVTGKIVERGQRLDAHYWRIHARSAVQFAASIQTVANEGCTLFLEIGPHATLTNMGKRCLPEKNGLWLTSLQKNHANWQTLLHSVSVLYTHGIAIDWSNFERDYPHRRISLPTYPFDRQSYWFKRQEQSEAAASITSSANSDMIDRGYKSTTSLNGNTVDAPGSDVVSASKTTQRHPFLDTHISLVEPVNMHVWESSLDLQNLPYLTGHRIQGAAALPISAYVEMAQAATSEAFGAGKHVLKEIELKKLLLLPERGQQKVQVVFSSDVNNHATFHIYSHAMGVPDQPHSQWTLHASGKVQHQ